MSDQTSTLTQRATERSRKMGVDRSASPMLIGFLLLIAVGGVLVWLVNSSQTQSQLVFNAFEVQRSTLRLFRAVQGAESAQRGFLLTGEERYLGPYETSVRLVPDIAEALTRVSTTDPDKAQDVKAMLDLVGRKFTELARIIALARDGRRDEATAIIKTDVGRDLMDQIRAIVDRLQARSVREIDEEYEEGQLLSKSLLLVTLGALAVTVILGILAIRLNGRAMAAVEANQAATEALNETLEQAVAERTTELTESNEEIQRFAYIVSHDLRAPLVNVMGFTSELEALKGELIDAGNKPADNPDRRRLETDFDESIGFIKAAIDKMEGLIAAILRLSREGRRTFRPERVEMSALVEGLADAQRHQTDQAGAVVVVDKDLPTLVADRVALEQIFGNLIDNAIKYLDPTRPGKIEVSAETIGQRARISVKDNGRGIAEADHRRVFELFRRAGEQNKPGEGIGLAHVQTLVRSLGGRITLASETGGGSTFTVVLPLSQKTGVGAA